MKPLDTLRHLLLLSLFLAMFVPHMQAQVNEGIWDIPRSGGESITEPSPAATAMRRYQDYPVSYATGTADISIPLLDLPGGAVNVSLGLSYQVDAIKKEQVETYVGLGWSLTGLGCVSRQIHGFPDEWRGDSYNPVTFDVRENMSNVAYLTDIIEAKIDAETDVYSYNIPGYSGSFIIRNNNVIQIPKSEVIIHDIPDYSNYPAIKSFKIITPEGIKYYFTATESVDFEIVDRPTPTYYYKRDYKNAVTAWYITKIESPDGKDFVEITYADKGSWPRDSYQNIITDHFKWCPNSSVSSTSYTKGAGHPNGTMTTNFKNQLIPSSIKTRCGEIMLSSALYKSQLRSIRLFNNESKLVKTVTLDNTKTLSDGRMILTEVKTTSDGKTIDQYRMEYNSTTNKGGYDVFGYANGRETGSGWHSVIDESLELSITRSPSYSDVTHGSLKKITDIAGAITEFEYEPSTVEYYEPYRDGQTFKNSIQIGSRIKRIITRGSCPKKVRSFKYDFPQCNINLREFTYRDFVSYSGTYSTGLIQDQYAYWEYHLGITHTSSLNAKGVPLEDAKIYYGKVTEEISGSFVPHPIKTEYNYELDHTELNVVRGNVSSPPSPFINPDDAGGPVRFLGCMEYVVSNIDARCLKLLEYHSSLGYIERKIGATPLLKSRICYKYGQNGNYYKDKEETYTYSLADSYRCQIGVSAEPRIFKVMSDNRDKRILDLKDLSDIAFYPIRITGIRMVCASTNTIRYTLDNQQKSDSITTRYIYKLSEVRDEPELTFNRQINSHPEYAYRPFVTETKCGIQSLTHTCLTSKYARNYDSGIYTALVQNQLYLPVKEKWVVQNGVEKDSIYRSYEYDVFDDGINYFVRPINVDVWTYKAKNDTERSYLSQQSYNSYDELGRIESMTDKEGREISATWSDTYDDLLSLTLEDVGLTSKFTYDPLVGCTSKTEPTGKVMRYGYDAGRLISVSNKDNIKLESYSYRLENDGDRPCENSICKSEYDDSGENFSYDIYNSMGMAYHKIRTIPGDRYIMSGTDYDALGRPTTQFLPIPTEDFQYINDGYTDNLWYYLDDHAYTEFSYDDRNTIPSNTIRPGEYMTKNPFSISLYRNNVLQYSNRCYDYELTEINGSEQVTLKGYVPDARLDIKESVDEDGVTVMEFQDWRGLKILERRVVIGTTYADTYYLYDARGQLRVIIQPEGAAAMTTANKSWTLSDYTLSKYAFIYRYDRRGNCIYSKIPGAGGTKMYYDPLNRLAFKVTAEQQEKGEAEVILYDKLGRIVVNGITNDDIPEEIPLMTATCNYKALISNSSPTGYICGSPTLSTLLSKMEILNVNYYDSYDFIMADGFKNISTETYSSFSSLYSRGMLTGTRSKILSAQFDSDEYTIYVYDSDGNIARSSTWSKYISFWINNSYTRRGRLKKSKQSIKRNIVAKPGVLVKDDQPTYCLTTENFYDASGELSGQTATMESGEQSYKSSVAYSYNDLGQLEKTTYSSENKSFDREFTYNLRGQLTGITSPVLTQNYVYEKPGGSGCHNGNISEMMLTRTRQNPVTRSFTYDRLDRLAGMTSSDGYNTAYTYTLNSSPLTIERYGKTSSGAKGIIDDLSFTYDGNRLKKVKDYAADVILEGSNDFAAYESSYSYDNDGRLTADTGRRIHSIEYNAASMPSVLELSGRLIEYGYLSDGTKRYTYTYRTAGDMVSVPLDAVRLYQGPFEMVGSEFAKSNLERVNLPWGYFNASGSFFVYDTDYQGNIQTVMRSDGIVVQTTDYYPYGTPMQTSTGAEVNRYKYGGKEFETIGGLNQYDFEARTLIPQIGLFTTPDPNAGEYPWVNPYLYCAANPIRYIDPTGKDVWKINEQGTVVSFEKNKDVDRFEFVDNEGKIRVDSEGNKQTLEFKYGTVISHSVKDYSATSGQEGTISGKYDCFSIRGDKSGTALFEMYSKNVTAETGNEIGLIRTGLVGKGTNYVTSAGEQGTEPAGPNLFYKELKNGYYIREFTHSHKSGLGASRGDIKSHENISNRYSKNFNNKIRYKVYVSTLDCYIFTK